VSAVGGSIMEPDPAYYWIAVSASLILVAALLFVRSRVRRLRQRTIAELRAQFFDNEAVSVAAFDYVRAKYEMGTLSDPECEEEVTKPASNLALLGSSIPYVIVCAVGFILLTVPYDQLRSGGVWGLRMVYDSLFWSMAGTPNNDQLRESAAIFAAAFLGGYLMTGRFLLRAVQNYELNQLTFLQAATQLVFGIASGMMVYHVMRSVGLATGILTGETAFPGFLLIAFIGGYVPTLGLTILVQQLRIRLFKTVDRKALETAKSTPLETIEGIDYETAQRLQQSGVLDVQNLATANPILLYVETPYGLYCTFDWVLQAQLCSSVGSDTFAALKRYNIRTSLDLERAVLADEAPEEFVRALGPILFNPPGDGAEPLSTAAIQHGVMTMLDDLHVHRVRMLWRHIFQQIAGARQAQWLYRRDGVLDLKAAAAAGGASPTPAAAPAETLIVAVPASPEPAEAPAGIRGAEQPA
jgi:hypothetical protein